MAIKATYADQKDSFEAALNNLFHGKPEDIEVDMAKMFTPSFTFTTDGKTFQYAEFVKHMRGMRENVSTNIQMKVTDFLRDGSHMAERHSITKKLPDGTLTRAETFLFAKRAEDGRLEAIVETMRKNL